MGKINDEALILKRGEETVNGYLRPQETLHSHQNTSTENHLGHDINRFIFFMKT